MIEEAAGTRMYECKKISAQKTIEKKEAKLKEIQTVRLLTIYDQKPNINQFPDLHRLLCQHAVLFYIHWQIMSVQKAAFVHIVPL